MKTRITMGIAALAVATLFSSAAWAEHGHDGDRKERHERMAEELNLSPEQKTQMEAIRAKYKEPMKQKKDAVRAARKTLQESMQGDANEATLRAQFKTVHQAKDAAAELRFEKILEIRAILTPEQRKKFRAMRGHHKRRHDK